MKILFFVGSEIGSKLGSIGGDVAQIIGVINGFRSAGCEVVYVSRNPHKYLDRDRFQFENLDIDGFPIPKIRGIVNQYRIVRSIEEKIRKHNPSLIYCFWPANIFIARLRRYGIPIVMICNTPKSMHGRKKFAAYYDKINLQTATLVAAVSDEITEFFRSNFGETLGRKVVTNPNGADIDAFIQQPNNIREKYGIPNDIPLFGFAGYFAPWHRVDMIIEAVQALDRDVKLLLVGTGPEKLVEELRSIARKKNPERIIFTGPVPFDQIPKYYSACDILVVAQDKDRPHGSSMKLLEYMSMGKPIAAAKVGQLAQNIRDGQNGLLFEPDAQGLQSILNRLLTDPELRKRLGAQAREDAVAKFSWQAHVERILHALRTTAVIGV